MEGGKYDQIFWAWYAMRSGSLRRHGGASDQKLSDPLGSEIRGRPPSLARRAMAGKAKCGGWQSATDARRTTVRVMGPLIRLTDGAASADGVFAMTASAACRARRGS